MPNLLLTPKREGPIRVAVLGGGMAGLSAAYALSATPELRDRFAVTVYQQGWRLGGKGASGRDPSDHWRISEHGLHVWFGCYQQAFALLRDCYAEIARPPGSMFRTVDEAFAGRDTTPYFDRQGAAWSVWPIWFPPRPGKPGVPPEDTFGHLVALVEHLLDAVGRHAPEVQKTVDHAGLLPSWLRQHFPSSGQRQPASALHLLHSLVTSLPHDPATHAPTAHHGIVWLADLCRTWLLKELEARAAANDQLRRLLIMADLGLTTIRGLIADNVLFRGFEPLDVEDVRAWFRRHGASEMAIESAPIRALYMLYFAFEDGDSTRPSLGAGAGVHAVMRLSLGYSGEVVYEMQAGMGDVVIAPAYEALRKRRVRFEFFSRITELALDHEGAAIERIRLGRQVKLKTGSYEPLIQAPNGLPCWPSEPLYHQIEDGDSLRGVDLESWWSGWKDVENSELVAGRDYDIAVLAISLAALPPIAAQLIAARDSWRAMTENVKTVQTQSLQLWFTSSVAELGWADGELPTVASPDPWGVWADRSDVLSQEKWLGPAVPGSVQYLCGPLPGDYASRPPTDKEVPIEAAAAVRAAAIAWLESSASVVWPKSGTPGTFDWSLLHTQNGSVGTDRLDAQWLRSNIDPTERYVVCLAGTSAFRLDPGQSGFTNLFLAGDWTRTSWNIGCIEAATESGLTAARAIVEQTEVGSSR